MKKGSMLTALLLAMVMCFSGFAVAEDVGTEVATIDLYAQLLATELKDIATIEVATEPELVKPGEEICLYVNSKYVRSADWQWQICTDGTNWQNIDGETGTSLFITTSVGELEYQYRVLASNVVVWENEAREEQLVRTTKTVPTTIANRALKAQSTGANNGLSLASVATSQDEITYDITYVTNAGTKQIQLAELDTAIAEINAAGWGHIIFLKSVTLTEPLLFEEATVTLLADQSNTTITYMPEDRKRSITKPGVIQVTGGELILGDKDMAGNLIIDASDLTACAYVQGGDMKMYTGVTLTNGCAVTNPNGSYTYDCYNQGQHSREQRCFWLR